MNFTKTLLTTTSAFASLSVGLMSQQASGLGLNAENYSPTAGNASGLLNETPHTVPYQAWMYGLTTDYVLRPVELGDGKNTRVGVVDHLLMTHLSAGYGLLRDLDLYGVLPVALWNSYQNPQNYLLDVGSTRKIFYFRILELDSSFAPSVGISFCRNSLGGC